VTDNYSGEPPFKVNIKIPPVGGTYDSERNKRITEKLYHNSPRTPSFKVEANSPSTPILLEKKLKIKKDHCGYSEEIQRKLDDVLSHTTGMASFKLCAHLLGKHIFFRSISNNQCVSMTEDVLQAIVNGVKEAASEKESEMPDLKIKLE
jgi:hypothetical protein